MRKKRSGLFGWLGRIKLPKFKWPFSKGRVSKKKKPSPYKPKWRFGGWRFGGWNLKKKSDLPRGNIRGSIHKRKK